MTILQRAATFATAAALALAPMAAFADTFDQHNDNTGNNSTNINRIRIRVRNVTNTIRRARISNNVTFVGDTGGNTQNRNTNGGNLTTGDNTFTLNIVNDVNNNF